jgi:hypothetical protein
MRRGVVAPGASIGHGDLLVQLVVAVPLRRRPRWVDAQLAVMRCNQVENWASPRNFRIDRNARR